MQLASDKTECLHPRVAFLNFDTFAWCFYSWANATDGSSEASLPFSSSFGQVINECISGYCDATEGCYTYNLYLYEAPFGLQPRPNVASKSEACYTSNGLSRGINADIAGPGALMSYIMQASILIYIWLAVRILDHLPAICGFSTGLLDQFKLTKTQGYRDRMRARLIEKATKHRLIARFILVEFQETQCYFMTAIQVVSILAMARSPDFFDADNFPQLASDTLTTRNVSLGAIVSITFGLWLLYKLDMKSWYTLLCSSITVALSITTYHMSSHWDLKPDSLTSSKTDVDQCGGQSPPLIWCTYEDEYNLRKPTVEETAPLAISLFCYVLLAILQVSPLDIMTFFRRCANRSSPICQWTQITIKGLSICIEVGLASMVIMYPITISGMGRPKYLDFINLSGWNFGQVIAVSVWAPVILKYFFCWSLFGVESYSAIRIPLPYKITNSESEFAKRSELLHGKSHSLNHTVVDLGPATAMERTATRHTM